MKILQPLKISVIISLMTLYSINTKAQETFDTTQLIGTWVLDNGPTFAKMTPEIKNFVNKNPDIKANFLAAYEGRTMTFFDNGSVIQVMANGQTVSLQWWVESDILYVGNDLTTQSEYPIVDLKQNRLVYSLPLKGRSRPFLTELIFTKI